jgi:gamma-glutamylcyclotransferase (GGCT)/AIG2-like uncharacterized protein YtfP
MADAAEPAEEAPPWLFVYGTLRRGEANPMAALLHRHADHLGEGTVRGRLYAVAWYPALVEADDPGEVVRGDLFALHPESSDDVFAALDEYEGPGFERRPVWVMMADETRVRASAYLYAASVAGLQRVPSGDWLRRAP